MTARAIIDLGALIHNLQQVRKLAPNSKVLAMIKANGYGHGMLQVAEALTAADAFGVACLEEALDLRQAGITQPIVLMQGFLRADELTVIAQYQLDCVIYHVGQIAILEKTRLKNPINTWLKIDAGMHRLGFMPEEVLGAWQHLQACQSVHDNPVLMAHFSDADDNDNLATQQQIDRFNHAVGNILGQQSLAHSAAIMRLPQTHKDWVRPGIMLYGASPFADSTGIQQQLKPVMTLQSKLIAVKQIAKNETIGYGSTWTCPETMPIGIVAIGYGDGYPRHAKNTTPVLVNNQIAPLIGRVSMDMLGVDLRGHHNPKPGDPVVLWGGGLPIEIVAQHATTISYELFCHVSKRVVFEYT